MIAGVNLKTEGESKLAVLGKELIITSLDTNQEILEALPEEVEVLAVNAPLENGKGLSEKEEELIDEGHMFSPSTHNKRLNRRALHFKQLMSENRLATELIRFDPMITSKELAIDGDNALESHGVSSKKISNAEEFDAVLGAVTARFYQEGQCSDFGVQVPEPLKDE